LCLTQFLPGQLTVSGFCFKVKAADERIAISFRVFTVKKTVVVAAAVVVVVVVVTIAVVV
jgi:hypothetical protein